MKFEDFISVSNQIVDKTFQQKQQTTIDLPADIEQMAFTFMFKHDLIKNSKCPRPLHQTVLHRAFSRDFRNYVNKPKRVDCWLIDDFFIGQPLHDFIPSITYDPQAFWYAIAHANTILGCSYKVGWLHNDVDAFIRVYVYEPGSTAWSKIKKYHADQGFICSK